VVTPYLVDTPATRIDIARYYDAIATMDGKIGEMTAELERRGLTGKTLVVFLSDNGAPFPREKGTLYDGGTREPLLFSWPGVIRPGTVYDQAPVSLVDLMPTLLEVAGLVPDSLVQGRSFRSLFTAPGSFTPQEYVFSERNWHDCDEHQRAVRDGRWKLIRTDAYTDLPLCTAADIGMSPSFQSLRQRATLAQARLTPAQRRLFEAPRARLELYDLERDPWEVHNLAADPAQAERVRKMAAVLQAWMEGTDDFPAAWRVRDDNTDRITGLPFSTWIPPLRDSIPPPPEVRWGTKGPG
jgi:arylsulfatase A-like enzyme